MVTFVFDTETTGLLPRNANNVSDSKMWESCRLVQIAWQKYDNAQNLIDKQCFIIKPDNYIIPDNAANIHGITTDYAIDNGITIIELIKILSEVIEDVDIIVAHNINFDDLIIQSELYRYRAFDTYCQWSKIEKKCTMVMGKAAMKLKKWPKLIDLYQLCFLDIPLPDVKLHSADADTMLCAEIYFNLISKL